MKISFFRTGKGSHSQRVPRHPINPRYRAYGKARLDIAARVRSQDDWDALWKEPANPFPFHWSSGWKQLVEFKVDDFAAEVGFFVDILGLPVNAISPNYAQFTSPEREFFFAIAPTPEGDQSTPPEALRIQFMISGLTETVRELERRGIVFEGPPQPCEPGAALCFATFHTPHGIAIDLWGEEQGAAPVPDDYQRPSWLDRLSSLEEQTRPDPVKIEGPENVPELATIEVPEQQANKPQERWPERAPEGVEEPLEPELPGEEAGEARMVQASPEDDDLPAWSAPPLIDASLFAAPADESSEPAAPGGGEPESDEPWTPPETLSGDLYPFSGWMPFEAPTGDSSEPGERGHEFWAGPEETPAPSPSRQKRSTSRRPRRDRTPDAPSQAAPQLPPATGTGRNSEPRPAGGQRPGPEPRQTPEPDSLPEARPPQERRPVYGTPTNASRRTSEPAAGYRPQNGNRQPSANSPQPGSRPQPSSAPGQGNNSRTENPARAGSDARPGYGPGPNNAPRPGNGSRPANTPRPNTGPNSANQPRPGPDSRPQPPSQPSLDLKPRPAPKPEPDFELEPPPDPFFLHRASPAEEEYDEADDELQYEDPNEPTYEDLDVPADEDYP